MKRKRHVIVNMGLYGKFITAFIIIIAISIALTAVGIRNINKQVVYGGNVLEYSAKPNEHVAHMSLAYNKMMIAMRSASWSTDVEEFDSYMRVLDAYEKDLSDHLYLYSLTIEGAEASEATTYYDLAKATAADPHVDVKINATSSATTTEGEASASSTVVPESSTDSVVSPIVKVDAVSGATTASQKFTAIDNIKKVAVESNRALSKMRIYIENGDMQSAVDVLNGDILLCTQKMDYALDLILELSAADADSLQQQMRTSRFSSIVIMSVALVMSVLGAIAIASFMTHVIIRPIKLVTKRASRVAAGYFDTDVSLYGDDEIGELSRSVDNVSKTYARLTAEMSALVEKHEAGEIDYRIDEDIFEAAYREVISKMNCMVGSYTDTLLEVLTCVDGIAKGNFDAPLPQYPSQKAVANEMVDSLREGLKNTSITISRLVEGVQKGDLDQRAALDGFNGDWLHIVEGLNRMMDEIAAPINEAVTVLESFSKGKLSVNIEGAYNGSFSLIKTSINNTLTVISSYVKEISQTLTSITNDDLNVSITREYVGDFIQMKNAINQIVDKFNLVLKEIDVAADEVSAGAKMISDSSVSLADSVKNQTDSIMKLETIMDGIKAKTVKNADDAEDAEKLSVQSRDSAKVGNEDMGKMLISMESIKESSDNISKIIKVIEDIAFQTNLLALNAAVEAARAGEHGKGFAVVAEEVRNLAARSQKAAHETTALIEDSIVKVGNGAKIANVTANALGDIITNVTKVSEIISRINVASDEQASDIVSVSSELSAISDIVQNTSGAAQNSASASEELLGQSDALKGMTSVFKLK